MDLTGPSVSSSANSSDKTVFFLHNSVSFFTMSLDSLSHCTAETTVLPPEAHSDLNFSWIGCSRWYLTSHNSSTVFRYNAINGVGIQLPNSPYQNSAAVSIDGRLVLIGGSSEGRVTNKLMTLHYNGQWIEELPPMKSASTLCAVVCVRNGKFRNHVIVIGGKSQDGGHTCDVQFFNTVTRCWYDLTALPQPAFVPSAAVCGNMLHVIGSNGTGFSSSIETHISYDDDETQPPPSNLTWLPLPSLPVNDTAIAAVRGQLVLVGGRVGERVVSTIHQLVGRRWVEIGSTLLPRRESLTVSLSQEKMIVLGGVGSWSSVELCSAD